MIRSPFITAEIRHHKEKRKQIKNGDEPTIKKSTYASGLSPQNICSIYEAKINLLEQIKTNVKNIQSLGELSSYMIDVDGPFSSTFANDRQQVQSNLKDMQLKISTIINNNKTEIEKIYNDHLDNNLKRWLDLEQKNNLSEQEKRRIIDRLYLSIKEEAEYALTKIKVNEHYNNETQIRGQVTQKRLNKSYQKSILSQDVSKGDFTAYSFCYELSELLFPSASFPLKEFFQIKCENDAKRSFVKLVVNSEKISKHLSEHTKLAKSLLENLQKNNLKILSCADKTCIIEKHKKFVDGIDHLRAIKEILDTQVLYETVWFFNDLEELKKDYIEPFLDQLSNQTRILKATTTEINISELEDNTDQDNDKFEHTNFKEKVINIDFPDLDVNESTLIVKDLHFVPILPGKKINNILPTFNRDKNEGIHKVTKNNTTNGQSINNLNNLNTKPSAQEAVNESKSSSCLFAELDIEQQYDNYDYNYSKSKKSDVYISNKNILNPYADLIITMPNKTKDDFYCILNSTTNSELHNKFTADNLISIAHRLGGKEINIRGSHHTFRLGNHSFVIVKHPSSGNRKLSGTYVSSFKSDLIKANVNIEINGSPEISVNP